jgi:hypothetical protein
VHKLFLNPVFVGLVLTLGLFSCAKEQREDDSFSVGTPEIRAIEARLLATDSAVPGTTFSAQSFVEFPALKNHNFEMNPVKLEAITSCRGEKQKHQQKVEFKNTAMIRVQDLLPLSVFAPSADSPKLDCLVSFRATNRYGSTHTFTLPSLQVDLTTTVENLDLQIDGRPIDDTKKNLEVGEILKLRLLENSDDDSLKPQWVHLLCETYHATISDRDYRNYGFIKLLEAKAESYEGVLLLDRKQRPKQNCRIVRETTRGARTLEISAAMQVQFELSLPVITLTTALFPEGSMWRHQVPFATVEILNPHDHEIAIAIPNNESDGIRVQPLAAYGNKFVPMTMHSITVSWSTSSPAIYQDSNVIKLKIAPHEKVVLAGTSLFEFWCANRKTGFAAGRPVTQGGFFYDIPKRRLNYYLSPTNSMEPDSKVDGVELPLIPKPHDESGARPLPGWAPLKARPNIYGAEVTTEPTNISAEPLTPELKRVIACDWMNP